MEVTLVNGSLTRSRQARSSRGKKKSKSNGAVNASLEAATARIVDLEKALKTSAKQRRQLRSSSKDARSQVDRTRENAAAAEAKYEEAVLKQVVRRETALDLATHKN